MLAFAVKIVLEEKGVGASFLCLKNDRERKEKVKGKLRAILAKKNYDIRHI
jgi:hypothetical protein